MHKILGTRLVLDEEGMVYVHYHLPIDESADMKYNDPYSAPEQESQLCSF